MGKMKLKKSNLQLKPFDRTVAERMAPFERTFETKNRLEKILITVVAYNKDPGQLGIDM